nr:TM2 domain-containing protein [Maliibacterium massiliense]
MLVCGNHPDVPAAGACVVCGRLLCRSCLQEHGGRLYCHAHAPAPTSYYSAATGAPETVPAGYAAEGIPAAPAPLFAAGAAIPATPAQAMPRAPRARNRLSAFMLCLFLGFLGAHYFYVKKYGMAALYLCTFGLVGVGVIVDIVRILRGTFTDGEKQPLAQ